MPVAIYKIDTSYNVKPFLSEMMNATAIAFDRAGQMYVSSRFDGTVYRVAPNGTVSSYAEEHGRGNWYSVRPQRKLVRWRPQRNDLKVAKDRQIFVFATLEASVSAYHLAVGPQGDLFVTGPTTSSFDRFIKSTLTELFQPTSAVWGGLRVWRSMRMEICMLQPPCQANVES